MKRSLFGFFFVVLMGVFSSGYTMDGFDGQDYERIADRITDETAKKLQKELNLKCIGTGGGMMDTIYNMSMSFQYYREVDLEEARILVVKASEEYLAAINNSKKIRPYLKEYPFPVKNVQIKIWILKEDGRELDGNQLSYVSNMLGRMTYALPYPKIGDRPILHKESYVEALRIVNEEKALKSHSEIKSESVSE